MTTHYLITANREAIGVTANDESDAMEQARAMGIADIIARVDKAMSEEEWNASLENEIAGAVLASVAADNESDTWKAGNKDAAARAYVQRYVFSMYDGACSIEESRPTPSDDYGTYDSIDVYFTNHESGYSYCATIWFEPLLGRLYGEW